MIDDDEPEIIYSEHSGDYLLEGERLEVLIYKTDRYPEWILEVVNANGTSTVWDDPFIADGVAWRVFLHTVEEEGIRAFLDEGDPRSTMH
ncbi:hypothetical protein [Roseovarius sp. SYSU LYC5161]|uniref:hypothetical protein n=1 Tax=Roseovarius halophilus (ex Wu et al. 2025) TaxID=3376060 RepID=UPI00399BC601